MSTRFRSLAYHQGEYEPLNIEFNILNGFPEFNIAGAKPSISNNIRYKHKSQIISSGYKYLPKRKILNLFPSLLTPKHQFLDIPSVLGYLIQTKQISYQPNQNDLFIGEISLDGESSKAQISEKLLNAAKQNHFRNIYIPKENLPELISYTGVNIIAYSSIKDLVGKLESFDYPMPVQKEEKVNYLNFDTITNNYFAKKMITLAVGSFSNALIIGEPGVGKTLLLQSVGSILPKPSRFYKRHIRTDSDRHPLFVLDSTITKTDLLSCQDSYSLFQKSHMGVLGLNELNQSSKSILEIFKTTLEDHKILYKGKHQQSTHSFIATMNPCKCGYSNSEKFKCSCNDYSKKSYIQKLGMPFLDRFDLFVDFNSPAKSVKISVDNTSESVSAQEQVKKLFDYQEKNKLITTYTFDELKKFLNEKALLLFEFSASKLSMSMRRQVKTLRLALSIAILKDQDIVTPECIYEAITYQKFYYDLLEKKD